MTGYAGASRTCLVAVSLSVNDKHLRLKCISERFPELSLMEKRPLAFMIPSVSRKSFSGNQLAFDSVSSSYNSLKI